MPKGPAIPSEILALIQKPPLLKGESVQQYNDLFGVLISEIAPVDIIEWLWVLNYQDCAWDVLRLRRFKCVLIDLQQKPALRAVITKTGPSDRPYTPVGLMQAEARWLAEPGHFAKHGVDPLSVPATASVQMRESLDALDKRLERAERRCDTIMQQLEYRREVFAHRARRAVDNVLNAEAARTSLTSANSVPALAPADQTMPNSVPAEEVTIVPDSSPAEAGVPSLEGMSAESPKSTSSSDA